MKRIIPLLIMLMTAGSLTAQQTCAQRNISLGSKKLNEKQYAAAIKFFEESKKCQDADRSTIKLADSYIKKCKKSQEKARKPKPPIATPTQPTPVSNPPQVIVDKWSAAAICHDGRSGVQFQVSFKAKNLSGKTLQTRCYIAPDDGEPTILAGSDPEQRWTLPGGYSGQQMTYNISSADETVNASFFVPFGVMDFKNNYEYQIFNAELYICDGHIAEQQDDIEPINGGEYNEKFLLTPTSITMGGSIENVVLDLECSSISYDLGIAVCGGKITTSSHPDWLYFDESGVLQVEANPDTLPREGSINVSAADGGNSINVTVRQAKYTAPPLTATINKVTLEEHVIDNTYGAEVLRIHLAIDIRGAHGRKMKAFAFFYTDDGETPLLDKNGKQVKGQGIGTINSDNAWFDDFIVKAYYNHITHAVNLTGSSAKVVIAISFDDGATFVTRSKPYSISW